MKYNWKSETRLDSYCKKLSAKIIDFEKAVNELIEKTGLIEEFLIELGTCELSKVNLQEKLMSMQKIVDEFNFNDFSNLNSWVEELDERIQVILTDRLEKVI
jgi:dynein heavy chain 1